MSVPVPTTFASSLEVAHGRRRPARHGRARWAAIGAAAAFTLGSAGLLTASADTGGSALTTITPCRLLDTRPGIDNVGTRATPLAAGEEWSTPVWGTNGNCTIPATATGVSLNVAVVNGTAGSYLTAYPPDAKRPLSANLNWVAGASPTPNAVTVKLSADGRLGLYNFLGTVDVVVDVVGYYTPSTAGGTGPQGPAGPTGPRGYAAWDVIPSGVTVTGNAWWDWESSGAGDNRFSIELPGIAPVALTNPTVNFAADASAATIDDDASCVGTYAAPTAPAGQVCVYLQYASGVIAVLDAYEATLATQGFAIAVSVSGAGDAFVRATWAYTAP